MTPDTCGCCDKPEPVIIDNRPGLSAIAYRVGTFSSFRQTMLQAIAGTPELAHLRTRLSDDYAITVLELWATVADILTFYQERIANEGFLRTARHRDSVLRLAQLLDYQLRPGVAATAYLAFTVEENARVQIPVGLRVQSVPGHDEQPQKFETLEVLIPHPQLNSFRIFPQLQSFNPLAAGSTQAPLSEHAPDLRTGDKLIITPSVPSVSGPLVETRGVTDVMTVDEWRIVTWLPPLLREWPSVSSQVWRYQRMLRLFGGGAPETYVSHRVVNTEVQWEEKQTDFTRDPFKQDPVRTLGDTDVELEAVFDDLASGSRLLVVVQRAHMPRPLSQHTVKEVRQVTATRGPVSAPVTRITLDPPLLPGSEFDVRDVALYELMDAQPIPLRDRRHAAPNFGPTNRLYTRLGAQTATLFEAGRRLMVMDPDGAVPGEICQVRHTEVEAEQLVLVLDRAITGAFPTDRALACANVALASHGEAVKNEVVGDGDRAAAFQSFPLKKKPVTFVPAAGPGGVRSSLEVLVNRVRWREVPSLYGQTSTDQVYTTRIADDNSMTLQFGDGEAGARPPSGRGNIVATYRQGLGLGGRVRANTLTTLLDRPIGVKSATNPAPAEGGADPETLDQARHNAPTTVRTFGRAVSLRDFEDLAVASGEVAKAKATWVWYGEVRAVHLTVAGQRGGSFSPAQLGRIHASLTSQRDPNHPLFLGNFERVPIVVAARLRAADTHVAADVEAAARGALLEALSFEVLQLGQPIHLSDIYRVLQEVTGVVWVDIDLLHFKIRSPAHLAARGADAAPVQGHLRIYPARPDPSPPPIVIPAEQAWIEVPSQDITILISGGLPA